MATYSDDFNRSDTTFIGSWGEYNGDWTIVSNRLYPDPSGTSFVIYTSPLDTSDNYAEVEIAVTSSSSMGVVARSDQTGDHFYLFRNNGTSWDLFVNVLNSYTAIGSSYSGAAANGDIIGIQCVGSTIKGFVNGVERASATDTTLTTGLYAGIRGGGSTTVRFDNFQAHDVSTGSGNGDVVGIAWTGIA